MKKTVKVVGLLVAMVALLGVGCSRTVDNTNDDKTGKDVVAEDSSGNEDTGNGGGEDSTTGVDKVVPTGCPVDGLTVIDLQNRTEGKDCVDPAEGENGFINLEEGAELCGVQVTAGIHAVTETIDGFFVADEGGGAWHGIKVTMPKGTIPNLKVGDVIQTTGDAKEYYCLTEFDASIVAVMDDVEMAAQQPSEVSITDLMANPEQWEGVLVKVSNVTVDKHDQYGGFTVDEGLIVDDAVFAELAPLEPGCLYTSIAGVIDYGYGKYRLYPRDDADLVGSGAECTQTTMTIKDVQGSDDSLNCTDQPSTNVGSVSLSGIIVATPRFALDKDTLHGFYATDGEGGPYSGALVATDWSEDLDFAVGDILDVEADWTEFYCMTELKIFKHEKTGTVADVATDVPVEELEPADLAPDKAEQWEGVVVQLQDVEVLTEVSNYGEFTVTGDVMVKLDISIDWDPVVGEVLKSVKGGLNYGFSNYKIMVNSLDDIGQ